MQPAGTEEGRELVPLMVGSNLTHINQLDDAKEKLTSSVKKNKFWVGIFAHDAELGKSHYST
jgi:hypothetical protein